MENYQNTVSLTSFHWCFVKATSWLAGIIDPLVSLSGWAVEGHVAQEDVPGRVGVTVGPVLTHRAHVLLVASQVV
jgi:hypothetical protein